MKKRDEVPDDFMAVYKEMIRADLKKQRAIERIEKPYGNDAPIWQQVDTKGNLVSQEDWFIKLPSDQLTMLVYQAQNQLFKTIAQMKKEEKGSEVYRTLKAKLELQNKRIDYLQNLLLERGQ